jgi:hypothetical protein
MREAAVEPLDRVMTREAASALVGQMVGVAAGRMQHEPVIFVDPELHEPVIGYLPLPGEVTEALEWAVRALPSAAWTSIARAGSMRNRGLSFGMTPRRVTHQRDSCKITATARDYPDQHAVLARTALVLGEMLDKISPDVAARDRMTIAEIDDEWRLAPGAAWTSGVVNWTSQLPYHRDSMNFDAWAAMPVIRSGVSGAGLHIPEYDVTLTCRHGFAVFFNGYRLVHGVTPVTGVRTGRNGRPKGYRYSIVYYALRGMKDCATFAAELAQGQAKRTAREMHQAAFVTGAETDWR